MINLLQEIQKIRGHHNQVMSKMNNLIKNILNKLNLSIIVMEVHYHQTKIIHF